ncbi:MAG TPA: polymer-forming cytoskeletal protein [Phycisphaerales bacterium]|nr:polymer-forming cytoskeletal protein [Phycisphaerales bacterium]
MSWLSWFSPSKLFSLTADRTVRCVHCAGPFVVPGAAQVLTCPLCYKRVRVDDVIVTGSQIQGRVETCGSVVVRRGGRFQVEVLKAGMGLLVEGEVRTGQAAAPMVIMGPDAVWRGDLQTAKLDLHPQARIVAGRFRVRPDRLPAGPAKPR